MKMISQGATKKRTRDQGLKREGEDPPNQWVLEPSYRSSGTKLSRLEWYVQLMSVQVPLYENAMRELREFALPEAANAQRARRSGRKGKQKAVNLTEVMKAKAVEDVLASVLEAFPTLAIVASVYETVEEAQAAQAELNDAYAD
jgi:hypothetical protein